ncbi:MAG: DNA recombination protein RmuC [Terracidiphilus sp.]
MLAAIAAVVAAFLGIALGFWLRSASANRESEQFAVRAQDLSLRAQELTEEVSSVRTELARTQAESASRAGFESLAAERADTIAQLIREVALLRKQVDAQTVTERTQAARISQLEAELRAERAGLQEKLNLLDQARQALTAQFEALAGKILEAKSSTFSQTSEQQLRTLLDPLQKQLTDFRTKVEQVQTDSTAGVTRLETLVGTLNNLNQQLSMEARNLTTALRGSAKAQGDWGEFILRDLLEKAGLREGEQYSFQERFEAAPGDTDGKRRTAITDVVVSLPGGRHLVIDSKVSLNAYTDSVNAVDEDARAAAVRRHLASVRSHVEELSARRYQKIGALETPDFVVMFIPVEPAFLLALQQDANLWRDAWERQILLVGPTTLLFVIRIVDNLWRQEVQARSVQDVMDRGAELYDKFVNFVADLEAVGKALRVADQSYTNAMKKLTEGRGNLVRRVEMLRSLGVRATKALPRNLLDAAGVDEPALALGAETDDAAGAES